MLPANFANPAEGAEPEMNAACSVSVPLPQTIPLVVESYPKTPAMIGATAEPVGRCRPAVGSAECMSIIAAAPPRIVWPLNVKSAPMSDTAVVELA